MSYMNCCEIGNALVLLNWRNTFPVHRQHNIVTGLKAYLYDSPRGVAKYVIQLITCNVFAKNFPNYGKYQYKTRSSGLSVRKC